MDSLRHEYISALKFSRDFKNQKVFIRNYMKQIIQQKHPSFTTEELEFKTDYIMNQFKSITLKKNQHALKVLFNVIKDLF